MVSTIQTDAPAKPSEWRELGRFLRIIFLTTVLPFLLLLGALEWLGWSMGETYTTGKMVEEIREHPNLVWMGVRVQNHARLKLAQVVVVRPDVLIMGDSRLAKTRAAMFAPYSAYNLARVTWPFQTYADLLRHLPDGYRPKVIIFTVDFWMFSPGFSDFFMKWAPVYQDGIQENLLEIHNVATQALQHPMIIWTRFDFRGQPARGISAIRGGDGFLADGSERLMPPPKFATALTSTNDFLEYVNPPDWKSDIYPAPVMGAAEMAGLKDFVDLGHRMGITMIAVQMPMYGPAVRQIEADPVTYGELPDFRRRAAAGYFKQLGLPFFDLLNFPPYSEDHRYFFDAIHTSGPVAEAVMAKIFSDPSLHALLPKLDVQRMQANVAAELSAPQHLEWRPQGLSPKEPSDSVPAPPHG